MSLYYPGCVQMPGPSASVWPENNAIEGIIEHSAEGGEQGMRARLHSGVVSWHFSIYKDGRVEQHYALTASCWHAGSRTANDRFVGVEHEGVTGEPLTSAQVASSVTLARWIAQQGGWALQRASGPGHTLYEHREVYASTTCPNGRIPWGYYVPEVAVQVQALDVSASIEKVQRFVRQATAVIADQNGDAMYEVVSGFPNAQPGYEYIVLAMRKDG